jgi:hypothetical protein
MAELKCPARIAHLPLGIHHSSFRIQNFPTRHNHGFIFPHEGPSPESLSFKAFTLQSQ